MLGPSVSFDLVYDAAVHAAANFSLSSADRHPALSGLCPAPARTRAPADRRRRPRASSQTTASTQLQAAIKTYLYAGEGDDPDDASFPWGQAVTCTAVTESDDGTEVARPHPNFAPDPLRLPSRK